MKYCIGSMASATIKINVCNLLTKQTVGMEVPVEETLNEIQDRWVTVLTNIRYCTIFIVKQVLLDTINI